METMKKKTIAIFVFLLLFTEIINAQTNLDSKTCLECHKELVLQPFIHEPAIDACDNCHQAQIDEHPQKGVKTFILIEKAQDLCFMCHEEFSKKNIHSPAAEGECLICHSPHGSGNKSLLLNTQPAICSQCHNLDNQNKKSNHLPVFDGNCQICHNPHESDIQYYLNKEPHELCLDCHETIKEESKLSFVHSPFNNNCTQCHNSHASVNEKLLKEKSNDLCFNCHGKLKTEIENSKQIHKVDKNEIECSSCHLPHASANDNILINSEKELCLSCHNKTIQTNSGTLDNIAEMLKNGNIIHEAIEIGGCISCHKPHSSNNPSLANAAFPVGNYTKGIVENFELCFTCHDNGLMLNEKDNSVTKFRDGDRNLHYVHTSGEKARNCNLCHNVHGSKGEHLLNSKIKFGNWEMPLKYLGTENGGTCNSGCHSEKKYFR